MDLIELDNRILQILAWLPYADDTVKDKLLAELADLNKLADCVECETLN